MGILVERTDGNFSFTYPEPENGTASGILVMLGDIIQMTWTPYKYPINGRYNITLTCADNGQTTNVYSRTKSRITTPHNWHMNEEFPDVIQNMTCAFEFYTPTGIQQTSQSFQFVNDNATIPTTFTASGPVNSTSPATATGTSIAGPSNSSSLSNEAKAGIAVGVVLAVLALLAMAAYFFLRRRKRRRCQKIYVEADDTSENKSKWGVKLAKSPDQPPVEAEVLELPQELPTAEHIPELPGSRRFSWEEENRS